MLFTKRDIRRIIIPLIIEQLLAVTIGMFDSMMVSQAGEAAISGVSLVDSLNVLLIQLFAALSTGGAVVVSQYLGKKDLAKASDAAKQLVLAIAIASVAVSLCAICFRVPLLKLIFGKIEADVMANAKIYFLITALSYPFLGLYNSGAAIFRAMGNSKISMQASLLMNVVNVSFNALFIFVFGWGAAGAAAATLLSRAVGATMMQWLLKSEKNTVHTRGLLKTKFNWYIIKTICRFGIPSGIENSMFQFGKVLTQSVVSVFGTVHITANAVSNSLTMLEFIPGSAIGLAMITIVGRCIGAGEFGQAKAYSHKLLGIAYGCIVSVSVVTVAALQPLLGIYSLSAESFELARTLILAHSALVCTLWPLSFTIPNAFRAAGDVKYPMIVSVATMWICRVGFSYLFGLWLGWGVIGVWAAMFSDWLFRAAFFAYRYFKGIWLKKCQRVE
ncbi:MAG: MATE family efflux transporter [Clostridia bacterium]|nr:MATE family efflux transporter [Clostridia bacterium]